MAASTPEGLPVESERTYVVYRARTGQIVHVHDVVTFRGAEGRSQAEDQARALDLAARDKYQFQWWAVSLVDALPFGGKKKGADGGIDGLI